MYGRPKVLVWRATAGPPALTGDAIHLWRLPIGDAGGDPQAGRARLTPAELTRAEAMRCPEVQARFIRTRAGLRRILAGYLGQDPLAIAIASGPTGKPFIAEPATDLVFNLTTAGDLALVAVGRGTPLGVDCEPLRARPGLERIAARMFVPTVAAAISAASPQERLHRFHLAWTALEAEVKADGRGLFGQKAGDVRQPDIGHFVPAHGYIGALARVDLTPADDWLALELREPGCGSQGG